MNFEDARTVYREYHKSLYPDFDALAKVFRQFRIEEPIENSNFLHALSLTDLMFKHTNRTFEMVTGGFGEGFIECLKDSFTAMLDRIKKSKGRARIIVVDGNARSLRELAGGQYSGTLEISEARMRQGIQSRDVAPIRHFIVADEEMVRDEEPHGTLNPMTTDANEIKAKVYFYNRSIAQLFSARFNAMWDAFKRIKST